MGRKSKKNSTKQNAKTSPSSSPTTAVADGALIQVDPQRVRYQHSRIRPYFSGCGRSVRDTLESIRKGELQPSDLPPIQVIVGPDENDGKGPWYFSLNNRRLWVFKQCRDEGLLSTISVRVRKPKSRSESERYSLQNCAVDAKFLRESNVDRKGGGGDDGGDDGDNDGDGDTDKEKDDAGAQCQEERAMDATTDERCGLNGVSSSVEPHSSNKKNGICEQQEDSDSSEEEDDDEDDEEEDDDDKGVSCTTYQNPFCLGLAGEDSSDCSSSSDDDSD